MKDFLDLQTGFYRPLWLRILITAVCLGWALLEFVSGTPFWGVLFTGIGLYCAHQFFIAFAPK